MKVKFKDGVIRDCTAPAEQKIFKNSTPVGWILVFALIGETTSDNVDAILTPENISTMTFIPEPVGAIGETVNVTEDSYIHLLDYNKILSSAIRYAEDVSQTRTEIQLSKDL